MRTLLLAALALTACDDTGGTSTTPSTAMFIVAIEPQNIVDATLDPSGQTFWFVGGAGLYRAEGGTSVVVAEGAPLVAPRGLAFGGGIEWTYVADPQAENGGVVFAINTASGSVTPLEATRGFRPQALDAGAGEGTDRVVFAGTDPDSGEVGLFAVNADASVQPEVLHLGAPLEKPDGVYVGEAGVWIADAGGGGRVWVLEPGGLREVTRGFTPGTPCGITATLGDGNILVSSLSAAGTAQVLVVDPASGLTSVIDEGIGHNTAAGGLHRAHDANRAAWNGVRRSGSVGYFVDLP